MKSKYHAALFIAWLGSTTLENRPPRIETLRRDRRLQRRRAAFGALRRFSATALWRRVLTALPPALERRLTASPLGSGRGIVGVKLAHPGGPRVSSGTGHRAVGQCRRWVITGFMRWSKRRRAIVLVWERSCLYGNVRATKPALSSRFLVNLAASPNSEADPRRVIADIPRQVIADIPRQVIADILRQVIADIVRLHLGASRIIRQHVHKRRSAPVQC